MAKRTWIVLIAAASLALSGCHGGYFEDNDARNAAYKTKTHIDSAQVSLSLGQVNCGVEKELWTAPESVPGRMVARLLPAGRDLQFTDDVSLEEEGYTAPYTQIRGELPVQMLDDPLNIQDTSDKGIKRVESKAVVTIAHECFPAPLPVMGIRKGKYAENIPVTLEFTLYDSGWRAALLR